jgi:lambda family phage minor tail protein L
MGQGQDKIARSLLDIQPTTVLEFFRIFPDTISKPDIFISVHGGSIFGENVTWQGVQYIPVPVEGEGFEINGNGQLSRPKIRIANKDFLITSLLQNNSDFKNAKIVRKRTFLKYLDDVNFDGGNPFGNQDFTAEISNETFLIAQKTAENKVFVEFELTTPLDLENFEVTHRNILAKYCYWSYRGNGCNYAGPPVETESGLRFKRSTNQKNVVLESVTSGLLKNTTRLWRSTKSYTIGQIVYLENPKIYINRNPLEPGSFEGFLRTWYVCVENNTNKNPQTNPSSWQKDGCSKKISACKKRFTDGKPLPFGGFPGTDGFGYGG